MREIARHADVVGAAQQLDNRADFALAAFDRGEAVALPVFLGRQLQIGRVRLMVLAQIPLDAPGTHQLCASRNATFNRE